MGHLYSAIIADAAHRWELLKTARDPSIVYDDAKLITGTDEHGIKIQNAAAAAGLSPQVFVDQNSQKFREIFKKFHILNTDFVRTTEDRHKLAVHTIWVCCCFKNKVNNKVF